MAPFLISGTQITKRRESDEKLSPAKYFPLYRKHRITLGNSLQYTEPRDQAPLPYYLRRNKTIEYKPNEYNHIEFMNNQNQDFKNFPTFNFKSHKNVIEDMSFKNQRISCLKTSKLKWQTFDKCLLQELTNCIRVINLGPTKQTNIFPQKKVVSKKKKRIQKEKNPGPGPGSYNLPTLFSQNKTYEPCMLPNKSEKTTHRRYLDLLVMNALKENIPGSGKYINPKSSFSGTAKPLKKCVRVSFSQEKSDNQNISSNAYDVKYKLVQTPAWSMKKPKINNILNEKSVNVGPTTYKDDNGNISYKIYLRKKIN